MGLHRAGFEVVGVDIRSQPHYPFEFHQADALTFPLDGFDFIWASPPCQRFSKATKVHGNADRHPDLVDPVRQRLEASGLAYVIENVVGAPLREPIMLCGTMFGLKVFRHRLFESNLYIMTPAHPAHDGSTGSHRGYSTIRSGRNGYICVAGHNFERSAASEAMGIDWMGNRHELAQAIPPAYSEFIGRAAIAHIESMRLAA